jgi:polyisoprenoid-binding protein YceI
MSTTITNPVTTEPGRSLETFAIDPDHSEVGFSVRHLLGRARGRFARFSGEIQLDREHPERSSVRFDVDAASIDTRQPDRDTHLRSADFFDVEQHPVIRFQSDGVRALGGERYQVTGELQLRGIRKLLALEVEWFGVARDPWGGERSNFSTRVTLDRKDFGMVWNAALDNGGFILGDKVDLTIDLEAIHRA